jgi:hypothetical protein
MVPYLRSSAFICGSLLCISGMIAGCADTNKQQQETAEQRQARMLKDPMGYKTMSEQNEKYDISGGDINHFDKDAFKKDLNDVLSP